MTGGIAATLVKNGWNIEPGQDGSYFATISIGGVDYDAHLHEVALHGKGALHLKVFTPEEFSVDEGTPGTKELLFELQQQNHIGLYHFREGDLCVEYVWPQAYDGRVTEEVYREIRDMIQALSVEVDIAAFALTLLGRGQSIAQSMKQTESFFAEWDALESPIDATKIN